MLFRCGQEATGREAHSLSNEALADFSVPSPPQPEKPEQSAAEKDE